MKIKLKILMIDDHPAILRGYELLIEVNNLKYEFEICKAHSINEALEFLKSSSDNPFQIIFLDINLPGSEKHSLINGEELGMRIRKKYDSKIIILSSINDAERISGIIKNIDPEGFIVKSEILEETLLECIDRVQNNGNYFSKEMLEFQSICQGPNNHDLDIYDLKIIHFISLGEKMKNLPNHVPLSLPSIERRKKKIKEYLGVNGTSDKELIFKAKEKGFV